MSIQASQVIAITFITQDKKGIATDADSLPTGTLIKNGSATEVTVTITNIDTGRYGAGFTIPADAASQDLFELVVNATVGTRAGKAVPWHDTVDKLVDDVTETEVDAEAIADAVWDEARSAHTAEGSFGEGVKVNSFTTAGKAEVQTEAAAALTAKGVTSTRQAKLDFLDVAVSTRATPTDFASAVSAASTAIQSQWQSIFCGMDHQASLGNALTWSFVHDRYALTTEGAVIKLTLIPNLAGSTAERVNYTASVAYDEENELDVVTVELTSTQTALLEKNDARHEVYPDQTKFLAYRFKLSYTLPATDCGAVIAEGYMSVLEGAECEEE